MLAKTKLIYERIKVPTLFSILVTYCCYLSLMPVWDEAGYGVCIVTCFLSYISATLFKDNLKSIRGMADSWWKKALTLLLFIYFNVSVYGIVFLEYNGMESFKYDRKYYVLVSLIWVTPLFFAFLVFVSNMLLTSKGEVTSLSWKCKFLGFILLVINYSIWLYAFNPCISSPDSADLFKQAHRMVTVPMVNWHPPFYAIVLSFLVKICDSAAFLIVVQCLAFSVLIISMVDYLLTIGCKPVVAALVYFLLGFAFNNVIQMISLWKDIPYMISILWLTFLLAQFIMQKFEMKITWHIEFVFAMVFTALFRQNGIMPAMAVAVFVIGTAFVKKKYKVLVSVFCFVVIIVLIEGPVYSFYKIEHQPGLKYFALANDIVGTYYDVNEPSEEVIKMVNEITENDPDNFAYNSYWTNYNSAALGNYSVPEFLSIYIDTTVQHPRAMLKHFMRRNSVLWSIIKPNEEISASVNRLGEFYYEGDYSYPARVANSITDLFSRITSSLTANKLVYIFAWRTGIYTLFLLAILLYALLKNRPLSIMVFLPVLFNILALYGASGWTEYRYYWPIAVMAVFVIPFMKKYINMEQE